MAKAVTGDSDNSSETAMTAKEVFIKLSYPKPKYIIITVM